MMWKGFACIQSQMFQMTSNSKRNCNKKFKTKGRLSSTQLQFEDSSKINTASSSWKLSEPKVTFYGQNIYNLGYFMQD